jgi:hypothetical protein
VSLWVLRHCVACDGEYRVWWYQAGDHRWLHVCCMRCRRALDKGYDLGLRASGRYKHEA